MAISLATSFPFNADGVAVVVTPDDLSESSRAADIRDVNLRRRLITNARAAAQAYTVTLTAGADQRINFVSIIDPNVTGQATINLLPTAGNQVINNGQTAQALVSGQSAHRLFAQTYTGVRRIQVVFPQVAASRRLETALIIAGELVSPQALPQSVRINLGRLRFERLPRGIQIPSSSRALFREVNITWTALSRIERDELRDLYRATNATSSIVFYDDTQSDDVVYGFVDGPLVITDRQFSDYSDARLRLQEVVPST